jgi:hypothetical protein
MNLFHTKEPFVFYVKMGDLPKGTQPQVARKIKGMSGSGNLALTASLCFSRRNQLIRSGERIKPI